MKYFYAIKFKDYFEVRQQSFEIMNEWINHLNMSLNKENGVGYLSSIESHSRSRSLMVFEFKEN